MTSIFHRRVVIVQRRMTHYRIPLFDLMRRQLAAAGVQLDVVFGDATPVESSKGDAGVLTWGRHVPCRYLLDGRLCWQDVRPVARDADLVVVTQENKLIVNLLLMRGRREVPMAFWGHGRNFQARRANAVSEWLKRWLTRQCDWWFAYTETSAETVRECGFPAERITVLNNSVDTAEMADAVRTLTPDELDALRLTHGIGSGPVAIVIASLHADKRLDFIVEAAYALRARLPTFELIVLGDGPQRAVIENAARESGGWMHWLGVRKGREKMAFLAMSQVMLNPGMVGLNVLDAFLGGVPMVTTDCGIHSPEIAYLKNGVNGLMTGNEVGAYVEAVTRLLSDERGLADMKAACQASATEFSVENMADNFCRGILACLAATGRSPDGIERVRTA